MDKRPQLSWGLCLGLGIRTLGSDYVELCSKSLPAPLSSTIAKYEWTPKEDGFVLNAHEFADHAILVFRLYLHVRLVCRKGAGQEMVDAGHILFAESHVGASTIQYGQSVARDVVSTCLEVHRTSFDNAFLPLLTPRQKHLFKLELAFVESADIKLMIWYDSCKYYSALNGGECVQILVQRAVLKAMDFTIFQSAKTFNEHYLMGEVSIVTHDEATRAATIYRTILGRAQQIETTGWMGTRTYHWEASINRQRGSFPGIPRRTEQDHLEGKLLRSSLSDVEQPLDNVLPDHDDFCNERRVLPIPLKEGCTIQFKIFNFIHKTSTPVFMEVSVPWKQVQRMQLNRISVQKNVSLDLYVSPKNDALIGARLVVDVYPIALTSEKNASKTF